MLADAIMATLPELRAHAESLMLDTGTIQRPGATVDELTGAPTWTPVYTGKMQVDTYEPQEATRESGGAAISVQRYILKLPVNAYAPAIGDVATITAAALDENLAGRRYRVVALLHKTTPTRYRLGVEEVLP